MIPIDFFRDEVRCGFRIPTAIKQAWAAQLTILGEIDRICREYDIQYFAEWGTLLGAARHRGFIPWDDDLDIGMKREDYIRFREVADEALPAGYCIHDYERQQDHWLFLSRVVNRGRFSFEKEELDKWHNYPWLAGIDIFVLDYTYRDPEEEKKRDQEVLKLIALADGIVDGRLSAAAAEVQLEEIRKQYGESVADLGLKGAREMGIVLYKLAEKQMARVPAEESDRLVQLFPWGIKGNPGLPKEWYDSTVRLPFEFTQIPVPTAWYDIVGSRYGSWMEIHKVWGGHGYPSFEGQRANLQAVADFELPCFKWDPKMAEGRAAPGDEPRRIVLFPVGPREWNGMKSFYEELAGDPRNKLTVIPLPLLWKNALGEITATDEEMFGADHFDEYLSELPLSRWYDYDPAEDRPDMIVIQDPYDRENPCLTVPPVFYAENLRECTGELVYIPSFKTDEFGESDYNDQYNLKHYVTAPGVVWADKVLVQSENIREQYVRALAAFAGEDTRPLWETRIIA